MSCRYLVSRHAGARQWLLEQGLEFDIALAHLDPDRIRPGDLIVGTLPLHLAAAVCERGARVVSIALDLPPEWRGLELDLPRLMRCHPRLEEFRVRRLGSYPPMSHAG